MNKILFQNNTVIPPEWLNAIQDLSYDKEPFSEFGNMNQARRNKRIKF
jgi:hypothetical protein